MPLGRIMGDINIADIISYYRMNKEQILILGLLGMGVSFVATFSKIEGISLYDSVVLVVLVFQAIITGYLSYKIYSVSRASSELPDISLDVIQVQEVQSPWDGHISVRCRAKITNRAYGKAKISEISTDESVPVPPRQRDIPVSGAVSAGISAPFPTPVTLNRNEEVEFEFFINGLGYWEEVYISVTEQSLGTLDFRIMLSDINFRIVSNRQSNSEDT